MTAWILNLKNMALSQYRGYNFNSLATLDGITLGASQDGIFVLGGLTDNGAPIDCSFETATNDYSTPGLKNISDIYVSLSSAHTDATAPIRLKVITDEGLVQICYATEAVYQGSTALGGGEGLYRARVKLSRGVVGRYWGIVVENIKGAFINVLSITPVFALLRRGRRQEQPAQTNK
ncbi:phage-like protein [Candidatus Magnetobacterium bavaricum]|uniref:Phage-like protein n=1 Tax=Candidatus Magnetobacterium bavaricum TaxID=29290 RepID=A0A0F3GT30_9BACT|nr:phage-like protein [Candidatus Magnetobacterium bavaricum]